MAKGRGEETLSLLREARDCIESAVWSWEREKDLLTRIDTAIAARIDSKELKEAAEAIDALTVKYGAVHMKPLREAAKVVRELAEGE